MGGTLKEVSTLKKLLHFGGPKRQTKLVLRVPWCHACKFNAHTRITFWIFSHPLLISSLTMNYSKCIPQAKHHIFLSRIKATSKDIMSWEAIFQWWHDDPQK
jgi:hypothetical protein